MEGLEREWTMAGDRRIAYYTNVPPGRYRFHVAAYEIHAPQSATERVIDVRVRPHIYRTGWFLGVCSLMLLASVWGGYRLHVRNLRRQFAAVLEERNRLAREMHDTLIQGCVGVSTLLEAASQAHEVSPQLGSHLLERARAEVRAAVDEARLAVWNLREGSPHGDHLLPAVSQLAQRVGLDAGREVRVDVSGTPVPLGAEVERGVMLLIREAVRNALRHAAPNRVIVSLQFDPGSLDVTVDDDGIGFDWSDEQQKPSHHYGLVGMRERVERMGGAFKLTSSHGKGTQVRFRIPLPRSRRVH